MYDVYPTSVSHFGGSLFGAAVVCLVLSIFLIGATWQLFKKAGKPGWACLVPFYGNYCQFAIAFGNGWLFLLMLVPFVNFVVAIILNLKLAKAFGKGTGFGIGLIFLPVVFLPILGYGSAEYAGPQ